LINWRHRSFLVILLSAVCLPVAVHSGTGKSSDIGDDAIIGRWTTERGSIVQVEKSGEQLFGLIIAVAKPTPEQREEIDREDPENIGKMQPAFDTRELVGVQILYGLEFQGMSKGRGVWKGTFYNDRRHKNFNAKLTLEDRDNLSLRITAFAEPKQKLAWTRLAD
jgi:uncharacterized protein (DUF2147 family)